MTLVGSTERSAVAAAPRMRMLRGGAARPLSFASAGTAEPLLNSASTPWTGVPFELHATEPTEEAEVVSPLPGEFQLRVVVGGGFEGVIHSAGQERTFHTLPGSVTLHTGPTTGTVRVRGSARTLVVALSPEWLARFDHHTPPTRAGIRRIAERHETARLLSLAMCEEVSRGLPSGALFAESLSMALLSYVFERLPLTDLRVQGALTEVQRRRLARHIEARLGDDLSLSELARVCGVGQRHFSTLFRRAYGMPPHRFLWTQRLERGAVLLATSNMDIAEIALAVGFSNQSHFTTAFRRHHGLTPARYRMDRRPSVPVGRALPDFERPLPS